MGSSWPVPIKKRRLVAAGHERAVAQAALEEVLGLIARTLVDDLEHIVERLAVGLVSFPAGQLLGNRVQIVDAPGGVGRDDRIADRAQRDLGALFLLEHLSLRTLRFGDVGERALEPTADAGHALNQARVLAHRDDAPISPAQLVLGIAQLTGVAQPR